LHYTLPLLLPQPNISPPDRVFQTARNNIIDRKKKTQKEIFTFEKHLIFPGMQISFPQVMVPIVPANQKNVKHSAIMQKTGSRSFLAGSLSFPICMRELTHVEQAQHTTVTVLCSDPYGRKPYLCPEL
jgi:hypothetical protein